MSIKKLMQWLLIPIGISCLTLLTSTQALYAVDDAGDDAFILPPLRPGCASFGTPINDYDNPICCVSGYVYLDGVPTDKAQITIIGPNGQKILDNYQMDEEHPYYSTSLQESPLEIKPHDDVTIIATYEGRTAVKRFKAREARRLQIDLAIPNSYVDSAWTHAHLSGRYDHAMAYDEARHQVVLFGGSLSWDDVQGDTWLWDGQHWEQRMIVETAQQTTSEATPKSPPARRGHTLVYHEGLEQVLLFGGEDVAGNYFNDLWAWDGFAWSLMEATPTRQEVLPPSARKDHAMTYDRERDVLVLFGGRNANTLNDTWIWRAGDTGQGLWDDMTNGDGPSARSQHAMIYDPTLQATLLYGGESTDNLLDDTWLWTGSAWVEQPAAQRPPALSGHTMAYHPEAGVLLFAGQAGLENNLWVWNGAVDGETWIPLTTELNADTNIDTSTSLSRTDAHMVYASGRQQVFLFGGTVSRGFDLYHPADTWMLDNLTDNPTENPTATWQWQQVNTPPPFAQWTDIAMSYEQGYFLVFGGSGNGSGLSADTFRWQQSGWTLLNPENQPPARRGHRIARAGSSGSTRTACQGSDILLFGGIGQNGDYLSDTWRWQGNDWEAQSPLTEPPARAYHTLSYDCIHGQWVLFGGLSATGEPLNDLWVYNGENWQQRDPTQVPARRYQATLTYNPTTGKLWLFGGEDGDQSFNDLWTWDGTKWEEVKPKFDSPAPRAAHGAVYIPILNHLVIAGGARTGGERLNDTWSWDGHFWHPHNAAPKLPAARVTALDYDPEHGTLVGHINRAGSAIQGEGMVIHRRLPGSVDVPPLSTISFLNPRDASRSQDIEFVGFGHDPDGTDAIVEHRWTDNRGVVLSTEPAFTMTASLLPLGIQFVTYTVQDNEGNWSAGLAEKLQITDDDGGDGDDIGAWTLLIYAAGDNDLGVWLGDDEYHKGMLYKLKAAGAQAGIHVGVLYDGPEANDTVRYRLTPAGEWLVEPLPEANMGDRNTLSDFVTWGYNTFDSDYYALHIASHANGIIGIGLDMHPGVNGSGISILDPLELREGLVSATGDGTQQLDLLHFDGCSFGLLENAAIADGMARFVIASPNTALGIFAYDEYRSLAATSQTPKAFGEQILEHYATHVDQFGLAYTLSLFDMLHFDDLQESVSVLGNQLSNYVASDSDRLQAALKALRLQTQSYDSGGKHKYQLDIDDEYVDLGDWLTTIRTNITEAPYVVDAATSTQQILDKFVVDYKAASGHVQTISGQTYSITFTNTTGVGIYYPPRSGGPLEMAYTDYINNKLFHITAEWGWTSFIATGVPPLLITPENSSLAERMLLPVLDLQQPNNYQVYLPVVNR